MLYASGVADIVGPFAKGGDVEWDGQFGNYFAANAFAKVADPQCARVATDLRQYCTLQAITDAKTGQTVLQNPQPGREARLAGRRWNYPAVGFRRRDE
jgi:hypothetical protein